MKKQIKLSELRSLIKEEAMKLNKRTILENEKKGLLRELRMLSENSTDPDYELKKHIIDSIDLEGYNLKNVSDSEKIGEFYNIFLDEQGYQVERVGVKRALEDYLRGMPSAIDLPTYWGEVINFLYAIGFDEVKEMEDEEVDKFYYKKLVEVILSSVSNLNESLIN
jgi:hypothetical protein